jgi:GxxExxY protein
MPTDEGTSDLGSWRVSTILAHELQAKRQVTVPIEYPIRFEEGFRADLIVDRKVILELKSVEHVTRRG